MPQNPNPYIAGSPVTGPEMFFGREDVFTFVRQALSGQHRDNVLVLYGQRRTGKTSVLYQMSRHLDERYLCIFIDLHGLALNGLGGFLWELANHIARALRRDHHVSLPVLDRAAFEDEPRSAFENTFLDSVWAAIGERHLLLMLDEAVRLEEQVRAGKLDIEVFDYLRHLMQHYPRLNFLFSLGSGLEEMEKEYAFLFNVALYKKISFLDRASAEALITEPVKDGCPFQPAAVERILEVTSGHPYFTQLICHSLFNRCEGEGGVTQADVDAVLDEAVERGLAVLKHTWEESTPGEKAVLAAMAAGSGAGGPEDVPLTRPARASSTQIVQTWAERGVTLPENDTARAVRSLVARDVIAGEGTYSFTVDLLRLWVQKFRRLEWVKEEIEEAAQGWARRDQELRERVEREPAIPAAQQNRAGQDQGALDVGSLSGDRIDGDKVVVTRKPFRLPIVSILVALAGLLAIVYYASGLLRGEAPTPSPPESQDGGPSVILRGDAALVSDLAVLGGYVWAATEGGLVRWSADGTYRVYPGSELGFPDDCVNTVEARPSDSTLWLGCGGVVVVRVEGDELAAEGYFDRDDGLGMGVVQALALDQNDAIWAGGVSDEDGEIPLRIFAGALGEGPVQIPEAFINAYNALFQNSGGYVPARLDIRSIYITEENNIFLGLKEDGILYLEDGGGDYFGEDESVVRPELADRRIRKLLVDQKGNLWAAASDQGLLQMGTGEANWSNWHPIDIGRSDTPIQTVVEFADGSLWAGGNRLVVRSEDGGATWTLVGTEEGVGSDIGALVQDEDGQVWAGDYGEGVSIWDGQSWRALQQ